MTDAEYDMLRKVSKFFDKVCVILNTGNIIDMKWAKELPVNAVMYVWQGGQDGGAAVADVLCGIKYPSGKLSDTIAENIEDYPGYTDFVNIDENIYTENVFIGYRYYDLHKDKVWYPFGHGLSYTVFKYENLRISDMVEGKYQVFADISNIGAVAGKEVIQLYVGADDSIMTRPIKELRGFDKIYLEPGETKTVCFELTLRDFAYYNTNLSDWMVEDGSYTVYVGSSSLDIRLKERIVLSGFERR